MNNQNAGIGALLISTLFYGMFGVLSRLIGYSLPVYYQAAFRSLITAVLMIPIVLYRKELRIPVRADMVWIAARSAAGMIAIITFFISINELTFGITYFLLYFGFITSSFVIGRLYLREHQTAVHYISLMIAVVGLWFVYNNAIETERLVELLVPLLSGISATLWNVIPKKISSIQTSGALVFWDNTFGAIMTFGWSLLIGEVWIVPAFTGIWGYTFTFGALQVGTGMLVAYGFRHADAHLGSIVMLAEVLWGIVLALWLFSEIPSAQSVFGGACILTAMVLPEIYAMLARSKQNV